MIFWEKRSPRHSSKSGRVVSCVILYFMGKRELKFSNILVFWLWMDEIGICRNLFLKTCIMAASTPRTEENLNGGMVEGELSWGDFWSRATTKFSVPPIFPLFSPHAHICAHERDSLRGAGSSVPASRVWLN